MSATEMIVLLPIDKVRVHPLNPRREPGDVEDLAQSIRENGVLEPTIAVRNGDGWYLVAGSRRLAAAKKAGRKDIPAVVRTMSEADIAAAAAIENLQREDLTPLEEAQAYRAILATTNPATSKPWTQEELGRKVGKAQSTIANALRLLDAPKPIREALRAQAITAAHARVALSVPPELVSALPLKKGVTVEALEQRARELNRYSQAAKKIRDDVAAAKAAGRDVTWGTGAVWVGGSRTTFEELFGKPPKKMAGIISGSFDAGNYQRVDGDVATHDKVCECRALGAVEDFYSGDRVSLKRVCVNPKGWRRYGIALRKLRRVRSASSRAAAAPKITAKQREKARKKKEREAEQAAARALANASGGGRYGGLPAPKPELLKGGIDGEPARLALFALASITSHEWVGDWRAALWRKIAKLSIKDVRARVVAFAAGAALREIRSRKDEREELEGLVFAHYGVKVAEPKKPTKKKARRR